MGQCFTFISILKLVASHWVKCSPVVLIKELIIQVRTKPQVAFSFYSNQTIDQTCRWGGKNNTLFQLSAWLAASASPGQSSTRYSNRITTGDTWKSEALFIFHSNADREKYLVWQIQCTECLICHLDTGDVFCNNRKKWILSRY